MQLEESLADVPAWAYVYDEERKEFSKEPDHNWASHDGDAFSYGAIVMEERKYEEPKLPPPIRGIAVYNPHGVTLDEMWNSVKRPRDRI